MTALFRVIFLWAILSLPFCAQASDGKYTRETLRGLNSFSVLVEELGQTALDLGLSVAQLRTATELRLRLAGIAIVSDEESADIPGAPYLYVNLLAIGKVPGTISYTILLSLEQAATMERNPKIRAVAAVTWSTASIATVGSAKAAEEVRNDLEELIDQFINAYLSVNPKH